MNKTIKSVLASSTVIIATSIAMTSFAAAADNNGKRKNGTVGIQSVLPKAPVAKNENNRPKRRPRIAQPKAPEANRDQSRQIVVVPNKPERQVVEAKPQVVPQTTQTDEAFVVEAPKPKLKKKVKPAKKVIKKAPKKAKKKIVKKRKHQEYGTYHYSQDDHYYESPTYYYEDEGYYETAPSYHNGYGHSGGYYSGSSYRSHGYSTGHSYSRGYNCK